SVYKESALEEAVGMKSSAGEDYYELKSGGFISTADVAIVEDGSAKRTRITAVTGEKDGSSERIRFAGGSGLPYFFKDKEDGSTDIYLYGDIDLSDTTNLDIKSDVYSSCAITRVENGIKIALTPVKKSEIWGMDIIYDGNDAVLYTNKRVRVSNDPLHPLSNLKVVIDPGHGGVDSGALGVMGATGPLEKELNFANAQMLGARLQKLGAKVVLTRQSNEENPTLLDRVDTAYDNYADIFISLHHNSVSEITDGNKNSGVEAYYFESFGKDFSESVVKNISDTAADRNLRKSLWNYFVVTKMRIAPAILTEIGFLPNPVEYEKVCSSEEIFKTAEAITVSILKLMTNQ
ncbi:MAG: N-acetylmuramoyl-L-alanine amidase, partial [Oscillospiraceae bacterium]